MIDRRQLGLAAAGFAATSALGLPASAQTGGAWRKLVTEPYQGKQDDISFVTPDIGWYGNGAGKLYRTADGGETWTKVWEKPGTFIRALGFVDERVGFLGNVGTDYYPGVTDTNPLYRSEDGGVTWAPVEAENIGVVKGICGIDVLHETRIFQGETRKVAIIHAAGRVGGPSTMLRSVDGGATWKVIDLSAQAGMILDVKFLDANTGFVCAATSSDVAQASALILRTTDGGASWSPVYRGTRLSENCWKMSFPTRRTGYASLQSYADGETKRVIVKTTDGGATWKELPLVEDARVRQFGIGFLDENRGWVGATTTGFETRDGGATWTPVEMGRAVNKIRIVRAGAVRRAFAIGVNVHRLDLV